MLLINSSKLSTPRCFSMSIIWWIFVSWLPSISFTLTVLFQNHVEWILPAFFKCLYLKDIWWFSWHMLSKTKSLPEKLSWVRPSNLLWRFFLLIRMLSLLPTFKFNYDSVLFLYQVSPHDWLGTMLYKQCFQEHHHQLKQEYGSSPEIHSNDIAHC